MNSYHAQNGNNVAQGGFSLMYHFLSLCDNNSIFFVTVSSNHHNHTYFVPVFVSVLVDVSHVISPGINTYKIISYHFFQVKECDFKGMLVKCFWFYLFRVSLNPCG